MKIHLNSDWALDADSLQWILQRRRVSNNQEVWQAISFVASTKTVLTRVIQQHGIVLDNKGKESLENLPETFQEFYNQYAPRSNRGKSKAA